MKYAIVIGKGPNNYSAFVPDLPGCMATGDTVDEIACNDCALTSARNIAPNVLLPGRLFPCRNLANSAGLLLVIPQSASVGEVLNLLYWFGPAISPRLESSRRKDPIRRATETVRNLAFPLST